MTTSQFLEHLRSLKVRIWTDEGGEVRLSAPRGVLTPELREELGRRKPEIVEALRASKNGRGGDRIRPVPRDRPLPLSFTQQRLWFLQQLDPELAAYNIPMAWRLVGELDVQALERALNEVVRRHEVLRTSFPEEGGRPTQRIEPPPAVRLEVEVEGAGLSDEERKRDIQRRMVQLIEQRFDLARGPLFRPSLLRFDEREHVLFVAVHHIVFDGLSIGLFMRELAALYQAFSSGRPSPLPELPVQYADFACWQREHYQGAEYERLLAYWKEALAGRLPILELPTDRPRPPIQTFRGAHCERLLPRRLVDELTALANQNGVTLYMVMLAAYKVLLKRYSGLEDVIVGSAINNRNRSEIQDLIGFFANTLVLRTDLSGDPTFPELLARVRETCLGGYEHQDMPFERLVDELQPERNLAYNPLFQTLFLVEDVPDAPRAMGGIRFNPIGMDATVARTDLTLWIALDPERFYAWAEYNVDLFERETIERLLSHYVSLLEAILDSPEARLSQLSLLPDAERRKLVEEWNATEAPYPRVAVHRRFEEQAERTPHAPALLFPSLQGSHDLERSYAELEARANRLARHLAARGVRPGTLVGLCLERSAEMVEAVLAIQKAGAAYVPLDPPYPTDRLGYMAGDAGLTHVVTSSDLRVLLPAGLEAVLVDEEQEAIAARPAQRPAVEVAASERAYVIYTSGSTGKPKGVEIEHGAVSNFLSSMAREPGLAAGERLLAVTTLSFDISVLEVMLPLVVGGTVIVAPREATGDGKKLLSLLERLRPDVMQATPATWRLLLLAGWEKSPDLRVLSGGEALPRELADEILPRCRELWNVYGPTEATIWSTVKRVEAGERLTIGRPIANTQAYVLDAQLAPCPIGVPGELWLAGDGLARGYLDRPELTAERFVPDPFAPPESGRRMYRTGDLGRWLASGELECLGRIDHQVKLRGFRIELGEIEAVVEEVSGVHQCVCVVREDRPGDQRLVAYWVREGELSDGAMREAARAALPSYMVPSAWVELAELPLTPNGKVDRKALLARPPEEQAPAGDGASAAVVEPRTPTEVRVADVWRAVLSLERVPVDANFFDLGGHSLLLAEVHAKLSADLGVELSIVELFQYPTVEALAGHIDGKGARPRGAAAARQPERKRDLARGRQALIQRRRR